MLQPAGRHHLRRVRDFWTFESAELRTGFPNRASGQSRSAVTPATIVVVLAGQPAWLPGPCPRVLVWIFRTTTEREVFRKETPRATLGGSG